MYVINLLYILIIIIKSALSCLRQFLATEKRLKMTKNAFYFTLKSFFVLKIFKFLSSIFGYLEKQVDQKDKVNVKFYDVITWETDIAIHTLPSISRIKGSQTVKFRQLTEYDMRNTFLKKSYAKCGGETIARPFSKRPKLGISLEQQPIFLNCLFSLYAKLRVIEIY